jgi:hypothetical protein
VTDDQERALCIRQWQRLSAIVGIQMRPHPFTAVIMLSLALLVSGCASTGEPRASETSDSTETGTPPSQSTPTPTPIPYTTHRIGETFEFEGMRLTVNSVDVGDTFPNANGGSFQADPGEDLVLLSSHFFNLDNESVDLSCSGVPSVFFEMIDVESRTIEPLFETSQVPGNPGCNDSLLSGQESDYNTLWRMVEGSQPLALQMTDTNQYQSVEFVNFTDDELVAN